MAGYIKNPDTVIVCMCVAGGAAGMVYAGFQVNMLDVAPRNASVIMGIANAGANTAGFLSPMLVGFITHNKVGFTNCVYRQSKSFASLVQKRERDTGFGVGVVPFKAVKTCKFTFFPP